MYLYAMRFCMCVFFKIFVYICVCTCDVGIAACWLSMFAPGVGHIYTYIFTHEFTYIMYLFTYVYLSSICFDMYFHVWCMYCCMLLGMFAPSVSHIYTYIFTHVFTYIIHVFTYVSLCSMCLYMYSCICDAGFAACWRSMFAPGVSSGLFEVHGCVSLLILSEGHDIFIHETWRMPICRVLQQLCIYIYDSFYWNCYHPKSTNSRNSDFSVSCDNQI